MKKSVTKSIHTPNNHLHYKDYDGTVVFSDKDATLHGKIIGLKSSISFEGDSVASLRTDFRRAVDEYLAHCKQHGKEPEKPYKGSFNIRIGTDLHRRAAMHSNVLGVTLNSYVEEAIRKFEEDSRQPKVEDDDYEY